MKRWLYVPLIAALAMPLAAEAAGTGSMSAASPKAVLVTPSQIKWTSAQGLPAGTKAAVISGDPSKSGWYTVRLSLPDRANLPPHAHAQAEYVTVLQGKALVGFGDLMNGAKWNKALSCCAR